MAKQAAARQSTRKRTTPGRVVAKAKVQAPPPKPHFKERVFAHARRGLCLCVEVVALAAVGLLGVIAALGRATERFAGIDMWSSLLPFAGVVLLMAGVFFVGVRLWLTIRGYALRLAPYLPSLMAITMAVAIGWLARGEGFRHDLGQLRSLVGGVRQAENTTLSHQVYAGYRRANLDEMAILMERAKQYQAIIDEAAALFAVDAEVMVGLGATESSFLPRESKDGGQGVFQITAPPRAAVEQVATILGNETPDWRNPRHNALIAAATWRHYLHEMKGDLFLSLLAYNIGPKNGGLLSIMAQYGAKDFVTIQPYLQELPRDYPIRVLTAALACRLYKAEGRLLPYQEGDNATRIQALGIPALDTGYAAWFPSLLPAR